MAVRTAALTSTSFSAHDVSWLREYLDATCGQVEDGWEEWLAQGHVVRALVSYIAMPRDALWSVRCACSEAEMNPETACRDAGSVERSRKALKILLKARGRLREAIVEHAEVVILELFRSLQPDSKGTLKYFGEALKHLYACSPTTFAETLVKYNLVREMLNCGHHPSVANAVLDILLGGLEGKRWTIETGTDDAAYARICLVIGEQNLFQCSLDKIASHCTQSDIAPQVEFWLVLFQRVTRDQPHLLGHLWKVEEFFDILGKVTTVISLAPGCVHTYKLLQVLLTALREQCQKLGLPRLNTEGNENLKKLVAALSWLGSVGSTCAKKATSRAAFTLHKAEAMGALAALLELAHFAVNFIPSYAWVAWENMYFCTTSTLFHNCFFRILYLAVRVDFASLQDTIFVGQRDFLTQLLIHWSSRESDHCADSIAYAELIVNTLRLVAEECGSESLVSQYLSHHCEYQKIASSLFEVTVGKVCIPKYRSVGRPDKANGFLPVSFEFANDGIGLRSSYAMLLGFTTATTRSTQHEPDANKENQSSRAHTKKKRLRKNQCQAWPEQATAQPFHTMENELVQT